MSLVAPNMPDAEYRATNALSVSGAKLLLPPNCPAIFKWRQENEQPYKAAFSVGQAAHTLILGAGNQLAPIDATDWRSKDAKAQRDEAQAAGQIPLLFSEYAEIEAMEASVKAHPLAAALLRPGSGKPEVSMFWEDASGVQLRGRLDWLPNPKEGKRTVLVDLKTSASADPLSFAKSAANYGYASQAAWYLDGVKALGIDDDPAFVFVVVEKSPPYLVSVIELDHDAIRIGRGLNQRAIRIYKTCTESNHWPSYSNDVEMVSLPVWWQREHDMETA